VRVLPNIDSSVTCTTPDTAIPGWSAVLQPAAGRLSTEADGVSGVLEDPCLLPPGGGYTGLENQLYRIEIHNAGPLGVATCKWSRDNATVATQVLAIPTLDRLVVDSTGRDAVLRFNAGDWVEVMDDDLELQGRPGEMRRIRTVDDVTRTLLLEQALPTNVFALNSQGQTDPARHTRVRRWDQQGKVLDINGTLLVDLDDPASSGVIPTPGGPGTSIILEHGVRIAFHTALAAAPLRTGDYWTFATRTADTSVERLVQAPPHGLHHHYCRLALLQVDATGQVTTVTDCRQLFPHGQLAITTGEVLFESTPTNQEVVSGLIDSGLGSGPVCVVLGMAQPPDVVITLGHNNPQALQTPQALLNADVDPPTGRFRVRVIRQSTVQAITPMRIHWWALRPERHLGQVTVGPGVVVTLTPAQVTLNASTQQQFTATVTGTANTAVTWSVNNVAGGNATVGTISTTGLYTTPTTVPSPATVTVRATSVADPTRSATATVTVQAQVAVSVTPPTAVTVLAGAQQQFTATVTGTTNTAVTWSVNNIVGGNATVGTITTNGLYQAPGIVPTPATVTVQATSVADSTKSAAVTVTVQAQVAVSVTPTAATVLAGAQQLFRAFVSGTANTAVTWSVNNIAGGNATVGTINVDGLYTAPAVTVSTSVTVRATSVADTTKNATAAVTVQPPVVVTISPTAATVILGATRQFSNTVSGTSNTAVTWSVTPGLGSVSATGLYTAPAARSTPASGTVTVTSRADPSKNASATVTIPAVSVTGSPSFVILGPGGQRQFSAAVTNATNTAVTWTAAGGSITTTGRYAAPSRAGSYEVIATSNADSTKRFTADVTVETEPGPKIQAEKIQAEKIQAEKIQAENLPLTSPPGTGSAAPKRRRARRAQPAEGRAPRRRQRAFIREEERPEES
jgi:hypothetical protein